MLRQTSNLKNLASVTLLLTGRSSDNVYKHQLARQLIDSFDELIEGSQAKLLAFTNGVSMPVAIENDDLVETWTDLDLPGNLTTLVLTNLGTDEMGLDHLSIVQKFMKSKTGLIVIEIGNPAIQTRALLERSASCNFEGHALILSPNTVYFCNNAVPATLSDLRFDSLQPMTWAGSKNPYPKPQTTIIMPNIFASAAKVQRQHPNHQHQKHNVSSDFTSYYGVTISTSSPPRPNRSYRSYSEYPRFQLDENVDEIVDKIMEEIDVEKQDTSEEPAFEKMSDAKKKTFCKYRKSCYETGTPPVIDNDWFFYPSHWLHKKKVVEEGEEHEEGAPVEGEVDDLLERKFRCKYRLSCYHEKGIPLSEREAEKERKSILASKEKVQPGKKKTLKEIAAQTLQEVQEASEKAAKRPAEKAVQTKLTANQEKLDEKLHCKYRKSCYETGKRPVIDEGWKLPLPINIFSTESAETVGKQINYSELENLEKKVYCKYRKSCYETGVKPKIEPEFFIYTLLDLFTIHEQVETRKLTLQEKCKYRKSCYETGIVPEINPKLEAVIEKEVSPVIPTNVQDLKLLCKYRKSCYAQIHEAATVDTIKHIRKRRQIEKEVTRRKARREKLHRRLRGEMQLGHWRKYFRKDRSEAEEIEEAEPEEVSSIRTPQPIETGRKPMQEEKQVEEEEQEQEEAEVKKPKTKKQRQPKKTAAPVKAIVDEAVSTVEEKLEEAPVTKKFRKARKMVKPTESTETEEVKPSKVKKGKETPKEVSKRKKKVRFQMEEGEPAEEEVKEEPEKEEEEVKRRAMVEEEEQSKEEAEEQREEEEAQQQKEEAAEETEEEEEEEEMVKKEAPEQAAEKERVVVDRKKPPNASKATEKEKTTADALEDMIEQIHHQHEIQHKKEYCKYRKSCYSSGKKPKIDSSVVGIISSFGEQLEKAYAEEEDAISRVRNEIDKKLACKYRKSCYETGILPEIKKPIVVDEDSMAFKVGLSKHLQCKYRKSCYEKNGLKPIHHEAGEAEEKRKPTEHARVEEVKETISEKESEGKRSPKVDRQPVEQQKQAESGKKEEECKPGTACYISAAPKAMKEDHAGSMARIGAERYKQSGKCSPYYYSCREVLGLPRKERAPIGPNGRRLCRKKQL
ncbi:unnamed protein product [Cylicocyclus nassatus]|uniref:Uncharacterized protein n=1 Tax=Cylicocyclus nassatus TaxID=53992 RepID=A0AA36M655_CYLNA|nr:unnamed protein product [Cylicocyclus nassatus]